MSELITKQADSLNQFMQAEAIKITPMACLSRSVIGVIEQAGKSGPRRSAMVVTLPGKPKAVHENFTILTQKRVL